MKQIRNPQQLNLFRCSRFITTSEAANLLKVSVGTVYNLMREGSLQYFKRGKKGWNMIMHSSVIELMEKWAEQCFAPSPDDHNTEE